MEFETWSANPKHINLQPHQHNLGEFDLIRKMIPEIYYACVKKIVSHGCLSSIPMQKINLSIFLIFTFIYNATERRCKGCLFEVFNIFLNAGVTRFCDCCYQTSAVGAFRGIEKPQNFNGWKETKRLFLGSF